MTGKYKNFLYYWLPVILYCALIFCQSSGPAPVSVPELPYSDKLLHLAGYSLLSALFFRAYQTTRFRDRFYLVALLSILSATLYGASDEFHQYFIPSRSADIWDAFADFLGSVCGAYLYTRFSAFTNKAL